MVREKKKQRIKEEQREGEGENLREKKRIKKNFINLNEM